MTPQSAAISKIQLESDGELVKVGIAASSSRRFTSTGTPVPEQQLVRKVQELAMPSSGLLPASVLWLSSTGRQVIFQRPPKRTMIHFTKGAVYEAHERGLVAQTFDLPLPWTIYAATFDRNYQVRQLELYCSHHQITDLGQYVSLMPLPNIYSDGRFCLPAYPTGSDDEEYDEDYCGCGEDDCEECGVLAEREVDDADLHSSTRPNLASALMSAYQKVWDSEFNLDCHEAADWVLAHAMPRTIIPQPVPFSGNEMLSIFKRWEKLSLEEVANFGQGGMNEWPNKTTVMNLVQSLQQANNQQYNGYWLATKFKQMADEIRHEQKARTAKV